MRLSGGNLGAGFFEPVGDEVGGAGVAAHDRATEERRFADDYVGGRPVGLTAVRVEQHVAVFDAVKRLEDGVDRVRVAVTAAPMDVAYPDGDAGEFGCIASTA